MMDKVLLLALSVGGAAAVAFWRRGNASINHKSTRAQMTPSTGNRPSSKVGIAHQYLLDQLETLTGEEHDGLAQEIEGLDLDHIDGIFGASREDAAKAGSSPSAAITPLRPTDVRRVEDISDGEELRWMTLGFRLIAEGKLGVVLLAGGQGTRLGSAAPKGCYDIGLPSRKPLFQLFAERLGRLQALAAAATYGPGAAVRKPVRWYILTSPATDKETRAFFSQREYFGLQSSQIVFFTQGTLPCLTEAGQVILETPSRVARAPDGNGGLYTAMQREGVLDDMAAAGVECCDCISVDNALVKIGDPLFAGYCAEQGAQCGARVVAKAYPEERVGVFARRNGRIEVVEYSELDPKEASALNGGPALQRRSSWSRMFFAAPEAGTLRYNWSNVCMHYFSREFLVTAAERLAAAGRYHIAHKSIPSKDGPVKGIKLELFIFDPFPLAGNVALLEVRRDEEFAPVKNAPGAATDSPDTARAAILALHQRWVAKAGGRLRLPKGCEGLEVSPTVSYSGEGLAPICRGRTFRQSHDRFLQGMLPQKDLQKKLSQARKGEYRTPGATPLGVTPAATPGATPLGSPRSAAAPPGAPFGRG